jgi:hypothetical protein
MKTRTTYLVDRANLPILPVYVERNPRNGNLFFRECPNARKRPLPRDPRSAEFNLAYHAALKDVGENNDLDDWSELEVLYAAQREAKRLAWFTAKGLSDTEQAERDVALFAQLVLLENPALDPIVCPIFEQLACDLRMLRARDRALAGD